MRLWSIITIIATIVFNVASSWFIIVVWRQRKEAYVRSRGPIPAVVSGGMNMVIVTNIFVQEIYFLEGRAGEFPCRANLFHSFLTVPLCTLGFFYRGLRVVILSTPVLRNKIGWLLSSHGAVAFYVVTVSPTLVGIAVLVGNADHYTHDHHNCYCFIHQEIAFWLAYAALQVIVLGVLAKLLRDFGDKVNMEQELVSTFVIIIIIIPIYLTILAYHEWETLAVKPNIQLIMAAMHVVWQLNTFAPIRWRYRNKTKVYVTTSGHQLKRVDTLHAQTVDQVILHEGLWIAFGETVQKYLCGESYWFLNEVREYEQMSKEPASVRFGKVQAMRAKYIKQGSNFEINIEHKMRDQIMKALTLEAFEQLNPEDQGNIFTTAAKETRYLPYSRTAEAPRSLTRRWSCLQPERTFPRRVLGENIIPAFHKSPRFIEIMAAHNKLKGAAQISTNKRSSCVGEPGEDSVDLPVVPSVLA